MNIGVDLDEVLADFMNPFIDYYNERYKRNLKKDDFKNYGLWLTLKCREDQIKGILDDFYKTDYFRSLKPIPYSVEAVNELIPKNNLMVVTSRSSNIYEETIMWLNTFFPQKFNTVVFSNKKVKKSKICLNYSIELFIEDSLNYALECSSNNIKVLLFDQPWNRKEFLDGNIRRVKSWEEIKNILNQK